jgi:hypothetical protein
MPGQNALQSSKAASVRFNVADVLLATDKLPVVFFHWQAVALPQLRTRLNKRLRRAERTNDWPIDILTNGST